MNADKATPSARCTRPLNWCNIFLADVRTGICPPLAIYLPATYNDAGDDTGFLVAEAVFHTGVGHALHTSEARRNVRTMRL